MEYTFCVVQSVSGEGLSLLMQGYDISVNKIPVLPEMYNEEAQEQATVRIERGQKVICSGYAQDFGRPNRWFAGEFNAISSVGGFHGRIGSLSADCMEIGDTIVLTLPDKACFQNACAFLERLQQEYLVESMNRYSEELLASAGVSLAQVKERLMQIADGMENKPLQIP